MLSKRYEPTEVDRRTWLQIVLSSYWSLKFSYGLSFLQRRYMDHFAKFLSDRLSALLSVR